MSLPEFNWDHQETLGDWHIRARCCGAGHTFSAEAKEGAFTQPSIVFEPMTANLRFAVGSSLEEALGNLRQQIEEGFA